MKAKKVVKPKKRNPSSKKPSKRKPIAKKAAKKEVLNTDFKFFINTVLADRLTGLEKEQLLVNTDKNSYYIYNVTQDGPGNAGVYNVTNFAKKEPKISEPPFDPTEIRVRYKEMPIEMILNRINDGGLNLSPDFQRTEGIWDDQAMSRLIESLLIRIPIPVFYIDGSSDDEWLVVDGLQRLSCFKKFVIDKTLRLKGLEFHVELNGKGFDELPKSLQRRILESPISIYLIETGTPAKVKFSIFQRINTGGLPLSAQEIRHALFRGKAANLLNSLVSMNEFKIATSEGIASDRMADRECALRALAFMRKKHLEYRTKDMDGFLNTTMEEINSLDSNEINSLILRFRKAMIFNSQVFGKYAFRKFDLNSKERNPINRGLFEVCSVMADSLKEKEQEYILKNRTAFIKGFVKLLKNKDFESSITTGTGEIKKVQKRFSMAEKFIKDFLSDKRIKT